MRRAHYITFGEREGRYSFAYRVAGALCIKKCMRSSLLLFPLPRISQKFSIFQQFKRRNGTCRRYFQPARFFLSIIVSVVFHLSIPQFCKAAPLPPVSLREYSYLVRAVVPFCLSNTVFTVRRRLPLSPFVD